jgi:hypothetical protein
MNVDAEIKNAVECIALMTTIATSDLRTELASEDSVYPGCLGYFGVQLPAQC